MARVLWLLMMIIWLAGLVFGAWWVWPHFQRMALTRDLVVSVIWLVGGAVAWIAAFNLGRQRYRRR
jgi:hypothetical protein